MVLDTLKEKLEGAIVGQTLNLQDVNTDIPALDTTLNTIGDSLPIDNPTISFVDSDGNDTVDAIELTGTASFLNVQNLRITATFTEDADGNYQMRLQAAIAGAWAFAQSFSDLRDTDLDILTLSDSNFVLSTYSDDDMAQGLSFAGTVATEGPLSPVADLLGESASLALSGTIDTSGDKTLIDLSAAFNGSAMVGSIELNELNIRVYTQENADTTALEAGFSFDASVVASDNVSIAVTATLEAGSNELNLTGTFENLALPSLDDIASLVSGRDLAASLPDNLQTAADFVVDSFEMTIALPSTSQSSTDLSHFNINLSFNKDGDTETAWSVGADLLTVQSIGIMIDATNPFSRTERNIIMVVDGVIIVVEGEITIEAKLADGFSITGTLNEETPMQLGDLLTTFTSSVEVPDSDSGGNFAITTLDMAASSKYNTYKIDVVIKDVWSLNIGFADPLKMEEFTFTLDYSPTDFSLVMTGSATLGDIIESLVLTAAYESEQWAFTAEATNISLSNLVQGIIGNSVDLATYGFESLTIEELKFYMQLAKKNDATSERIVQFNAAINWQTGIDFVGEINADFAIEKIASNAATGEVTGQIDLIDNLTLSAGYAFGDSSELIFQVLMASLEITATYTPDDSELEFKFTTDEKFSATDLLTLIVQLVDPTIEYFELDSPWNEILEKISFDLSGITVTVNFGESDGSGKSIGFDIDLDINVLDLLTIKSFGLSVEKVKSGAKWVNKSKIRMSLSSNTLGIDNKSVDWDPIDEAPPEVPGKGTSAFDLQYLALGQRVMFSDTSATTIPEIMAILIDAVGTEPEDGSILPGGALTFSRDAGWFIGAKFVIIETLDMSLIFNDPVMYGVRIELSGETAKNFAGLVFEILYRRISDTIGVYHIELVLPDVMRQLEFGAVSVTLPIIVIDIYTNGDFKLDLGFPWNSDFTRSFALQVFPFTGAGGLYFNKLSAETATSVPQISSGIFNPVLEFGVGLKIGLGKSFNKGPLKAEFSITVEGIVQGVLAWYYPNDSVKSTDLYYYVQGSISIVGRIYGAVDFEVIRVDVEVIARATAAFTIEVYQPSYVVLSAEVSVKASVKVLFVKVKFSFSLSVREDFTIGSASTPPWTLDSAAIAGGSGDLSIRKLPPTFAPYIVEMDALDTIAASYNTIIAASRIPTALSWQLPTNTTGEVISIFAGGTKQDLTIYFQPAYTRSQSGLEIVALTFIENAIPYDETNYTNYGNSAVESDFNTLVQALMAWAVYAHYMPPANDTTTTREEWTLLGTDAGEIERDQLAMLYDSLANGFEDDQNPLNAERLLQFLESNFTLTITDATADTSASIFPMMPMLLLDHGEKTIDFSAQTITQTDITRYQTYFANLQVGQGSDPVMRNASETALPIAEFVLVDYVLLIMRTAVQNAVDHMDDKGLASATLETLLTAITENGSMNQIAAMASRFLLHGLRLPEDDSGSVMTPLYEKTGQQFTVTAAEIAPVTTTDADTGDTTTTYYNLRLYKPAVAEGETDQYAWITFDDVDTEGDDGELNYALEETVVALLNGMNNLTNAQIQSALPTTAPTIKDSYENVARQFRVRDSHEIDENGTKVYLYDLPAGLQTALVSDVGATYTVHDATDDTALADTTWLTRLEVTLKRVPSNDGTTLLKNTYLLSGMDEDDRTSLLQIWETGTDPTVCLFFSSSILKDDAATVRILKTNLSTATSNDVQIYDAIPAEATNFAKLVWQSTTVAGGGYYLYFADANGDGLPDSLFTDGQNGVISLLLTSDGGTAPATYTNALIVRNSDNDAATVTIDTDLIIKSSATIAVPTLRPGIMAYTLDRTLIEGESLSESSDELANLYQMLGYMLSGTGVFDGTSLGREALPIGPSDEPIDENDASAGEKWLYERMIPLYQFISTSDTNSAPAAADDPYLGIGDAGSLALNFWWQDIYGNRLNLADFSETLTLTPRYRDPLIGVGQYPGLALSYVFSAGDSGAVMTIYFEFEQSQYVPSSSLPYSEAMKRIEAALATYTTIVYQTRHIDDLTFTVESSILTGDAGTLRFNSKTDGETRPAQIATFAQSTYDFFTVLQELEAYTHTVANGDTLDSLATQYNTTAAAIAQVNSDAYGVFGTSDLKVGDEVITLTGQETLSEISLEKSITLDQIASDNASLVLSTSVIQNDDDNTTGVLVIPERVVLPDSVSTVQIIGSSQQQLVQLSTTIDQKAEWIAANISLMNILVIGDLTLGTDQPTNWRFTANQWTALAGQTITISATDTLSTVMTKIAKMIDASGATVLGADDLAGILSSITLFADGARLITPPTEIELAIEFQSAVANYPSELIFPVKTTITTERDSSLVDATIDVEDITRSSSVITPRSRNLEDSTTNYELTLSEFAANFEATFDELYLAIGSSEDDSSTDAALWAVHIGANGLQFNIVEVDHSTTGTIPYFFTPQPLANTLLSDTVPLSTFAGDATTPYDPTATEDERIEAVDMNVWALQFLQTAQDVLSPDFALPAMTLDSTIDGTDYNGEALIQEILEQKETLAEAIRQQVTNVLSAQSDIETRRGLAAELLEQRLRIHLADAYDIESVVQLDVEITIAEGKTFPNAQLARLVGKPYVQAMTDRDNVAIATKPDFTLSGTKIPLVAGTQQLTFFFDTQKPEKHEDVVLDLILRANEIQFAIDTVGEYEDSKWLTFIRPLYENGAVDEAGTIANRLVMGTVDIPVPLRTYPMPPSLIQQSSIADPDSVENLSKVLEWAYQFTYEHLDIAQDSIEAYVQYNQITANPLTAETQDVKAKREVLFEALATFIANEAAIENSLQALTDDNPKAAQDSILLALDAFAQMMGTVAAAWKDWSSQLITDRTAESTTSLLDGKIYTRYDIIENEQHEVTVDLTALEGFRDQDAEGFDFSQYLPEIIVPYYKETTATISDDKKSVTYEYTAKTEAELEADPEVIFGESSIPDRTANINNLNILDQQSAWAAIRLIRNKFLITDMETNPAFIYQTPQVRFSNAKTVYLVNQTYWDVGTLLSDGTHDLKDYLTEMFATILPATANVTYSVQVGVRYGFAIASLGDETLRTTVPVLLGLRLNIETGSDLTTVTDAYITTMVDAVTEWRESTRPQETGGEFLFTLSIFASLQDEAPLLRIKNLTLDIDRINKLATAVGD